MDILKGNRGFKGTIEIIKRYMSMFVIPKKVRLRLEKIQRDFLWGFGEKASFDS